MIQFQEVTKHRRALDKVENKIYKRLLENNTTPLFKRIFLLRCWFILSRTGGKYQFSDPRNLNTEECCKLLLRIIARYGTHYRFFNSALNQLT